MKRLEIKGEKTSLATEGMIYVPSGSGIIKPGARLISIQIDADGEYWLCDADMDASRDFRDQGCVAHSAIQMAEGG